MKYSISEHFYAMCKLFLFYASKIQIPHTHYFMAKLKPWDLRVPHTNYTERYTRNEEGQDAPGRPTGGGLQRYAPARTYFECSIKQNDAVAYTRNSRLDIYHATGRHYSGEPAVRSKWAQSPHPTHKQERFHSHRFDAQRPHNTGLGRGVTGSFSQQLLNLKG